MTSAVAFRGKGDPGGGHGGVLRDAITEALRAKTDESPSIKSKMDDVAEAVAAVKRDLIGELPKMRRAGRTDVSDPKVSINALTLEFRISTQFDLEPAVQGGGGLLQRADRHGRVVRVKQPIQGGTARLHPTCHGHLGETKTLHLHGDLMGDDALGGRRCHGFQKPVRSRPRLMRLGRLSWPVRDHSPGSGLCRGASARTSPRSSVGTVLVPTQSTRRRS